MAGDSTTILEDELRRFLRSSAGRRFDWVACNCGFWVCEWIHLVTRDDPVSHVRGRYKTAGGFRRHIVASGGNEAFSRAIAERVGMVETDYPNIGDVGLVVTGDGTTMAIKADRSNWVLKTRKGIAVGPFEQIIAWRL